MVLKLCKGDFRFARVKRFQGLIDKAYSEEATRALGRY